MELVSGCDKSMTLHVQVILAEIYTTGFQRSFSDEDDLTSIAESDVIYAFQATPLYVRGGSTRISGNHSNTPRPLCRRVCQYCQGLTWQLQFAVETLACNCRTCMNFSTWHRS